MGQFFQIVFVYKGSLVIHTTAPKRVLQNEEDLHLAIKLFLEDFVEICNLGSDIKAVVNVDVVLSQNTFASR